MKSNGFPSWSLAIFVILALFPVFPGFDGWFRSVAGRSLADQLPGLFIFAILALALNIVVGNVGILHLGIAAFFGIGAYVTGILTVPAYPFELSFWLALVIGVLVTAAFGVLIGVPTLRLRGDYLALVTLGFGEVVKFAIKNLSGITGGPRGLNPVPPPEVPGVTLDQWASDYRQFYYLTLGFLGAVYFILYRIERSKLGRAMVAIREDELAASCMGLNVSRMKLAAFVFAAAIAGLAGCLYASRMTSTVGPDAYDFNKSIFLLCCVILGGLGSRNGVLLGVFLLYGFDNILSPIVDDILQVRFGSPERRLIPLGLFDLPISGQMQTFSGWRLFVFGFILILVMRFRPSGLLPSNRVKEENLTPPPVSPTAGGNS
jgi:branched-chain amino acid transport system permease protein